MQKNKVAAYLRLSKEEFNNEKESNSIINQRRMIDDYLLEHEEYKLVDYYIDDGYSGTNFNRPEFQRMIKEIKEKEIKVIVVKDLSRFGRNYIETGNYLEVILPAMGVSVISINEDCEIDSSSYYGNDYVPLKSLLNDMYAKDISKKVRSSLIVKKHNGEFIGKLAPYGYIKDPKDMHKFIIDKNVSKIIIEIFDMVLYGKSRKEISNYLNKKEIMTPSEYLKININSDKDIKVLKKWNPEMVNRILRNENYTGTLFQGKKRKLNYRVNKKIVIDKDDWIITENHHEAIISKEDFDKVQAILDNNKARMNTMGTYDIFSGYIKCNDCDSTMIIRKGKNKKYYYCSSYIKNGLCTKHSITKDELEEMVLKELKLRNNIDKLNRKIIYNYIKCIYVKENKKIDIKYKH